MLFPPEVGGPCFLRGVSFYLTTRNPSTVQLEFISGYRDFLRPNLDHIRSGKEKLTNPCVLRSDSNRPKHKLALSSPLGKRGTVDSRGSPQSWGGQPTEPTALGRAAQGAHSPGKAPARCIAKRGAKDTPGPWSRYPECWQEHDVF